MESLRPSVATRRTQRRSRRGFSLVEVLVVISVIGIIAAIAVPFIGTIASAAKESKAKQNAASAANISAQLSAAGAEHVIPEFLGGAEATTRLLRRGITVQDGAFAGVYFGLPSLGEEEVGPTAVYLEVILSYSVLSMIFTDG